MDSLDDASKDGGRRLGVALVGVFVLSRIGFAASGVTFDASILPIAWQYLDPEWLRHDLLSSVLHLHAQPPLFNLGLGAVLKLAPDHAAAVFHGLYALIGLVIYGVLYRLLRRVGYGVGWAFGLATLFIVWPGSVLYEHWLFYTWPVAGLLVVAAMALVRYEDTGSLRDAAVFLVALVAVCWIRSAFHLVYLMAAVTLLLIIPRSSSRRPILAMSAAAVALVALIFVKNLVLFGSFASSSWMGMSLWRIAGQGHPDVAALVADGTLPAIAAIDAFSPVGDYPERYREIPPRFADVEALTVEKKTVGRTVGRGFDNLNHVAYLDLSADYRQAASTMIRHDPVGFLGRVALAWGTYSKPSWEYDFVAHNRPALRGWIDAVTLASPRFAIERQVTGREPPFVFPLSSLLVIPAAFVVVMLAAIGRTRRVAAGTWRRGDAFLLFAATTIAYVGLVGNTFELGENHRFRVVTDPLLFVATLAVVRSWIVAYSTTRDQPDIERSSKLSEKTTEPP